MQHEVSQFKLAGGARLLFIYVPNAITYYWGSVFRAGYHYVSRRLYEMPHLAEHLAFEGTRAHPDGLKFKVEVEQDGTYYNATTNYELVSYYFVGGKDNLERIIPLNLGQIFEPLYDQRRIDQEKQVITREMSRKKEDDSWRSMYLTTAAILPERNPAIDERIGNIGHISREDLLGYNTDCYGVANTDFVLVGEYDAKTVKSIVTDLNTRLLALPLGRRKEIKPGKFAQAGGLAQAFPSYLDNQSTFHLRFSVKGRQLEDALVLDVISALCTGGMSARMGRKAREAGLTYGIGTGVAVDQDVTYFAANSQTNLEQLEPLVKLAAEELSAVAAGSFSDAELTRAVGYWIGNLRRSNQTPAAFATWYGGRFVRDWPIDSPEEIIAKVQTVDRARIEAVAQKYFVYENAVLTVVGNDLEGKVEDYKAMLRRYFK